MDNFNLNIFLAQTMVSTMLYLQPWYLLNSKNLYYEYKSSNFINPFNNGLTIKWVNFN